MLRLRLASSVQEDAIAFLQYHARWFSGTSAGSARRDGEEPSACRLSDVPGEMNIRREEAAKLADAGRIGVVRSGAGCASGIRAKQRADALEAAQEDSTMRILLWQG